VYFKQQGSGPGEILFLHGNLGSSRWWDKVFSLLPPDWRAIAPDFRGFGRSPALTGDFTIAAAAKDVAALIERMQLSRPALVGHSLGGAVALQYALDNPRKIRALVLVDPVPPGGLHLSADVFRLLDDMRRRPGMMKEGLRATAPSAPDDDFFASLVQDALQSTPQAFLEIPNATAKFDVMGRLRELSCPTLCILGKDDFLVPREDVSRMCGLISNCVLEEMEGVGHCPPIEAPERLTELLIQFLRAKTVADAS
jgi:pimeloyl-ACP methyl ester carboxylesterase